MTGVTVRGSLSHLTTHSAVHAIPIVLVLAASACAGPTDLDPAEATPRASATPATDTSEEPPSPHTHLDQVWTDDPELAPHVKSAVERWSKATGRSWVFAKGPRTVVWGDPGSGSMGKRVGDDIVMSSAWRESVWLGRVVTHELGHYFRAGHTGNPWSLMYESLANVDCLSRADLEFVCGGWPCTSFEVECDWLAPHDTEDVGGEAPSGENFTAPDFD